MTRNECMEILSDKNNPKYKELHHIYYTNHNKAKKYFKELGFDTNYVLHHAIIDCTNYEEWNIAELIPMTKQEHSYLHMMIYQQGLGSQASKDKAHATLREKYHNGELKAWNSGLTKETDNRIKESPRKGKTGDEFPFLRASKKGKSGGWNKNISKDDPRYSSLLWTDERKDKASQRLKENNPMKNVDSRKKVGDSKIGKKCYSNGVETHYYIPGTEPDGYLPTYYFSKRYKQQCKK